jgi:type II secretion system protein N
MLRSTLANLRPVPSIWLALWAFTKKLPGRLPLLSTRNSWLLYTLACFLLFLLLTFPSDLLLRRFVVSLTQESAIRLRYGAGDLTWWGGCEFSNVTVESPISGMSMLQVSRLTLSPSLIGLFQGQPFPLTFHAVLYGGTFSGTVQHESERFGTQFVLQQLSLERWPFPAPWDRGRVAGRVNADGELQGNLAALQAVHGSLRVILTDGLLGAGTIAMVPVPAVQALQARLRATLADGRVEVSELILSADGVEASLQGTMILRTPLERSGLDLRLTARMTGSPSPALKTLLALLPASPNAPGERRAVITGSLAAPVVR